MAEPRYKIGDRVKIIKFGHPFWVTKEELKVFPTSRPPLYEDETRSWFDMSPEIVGKKGVVSKVTVTQGVPKYTIEGIKGKHAWYTENQMEKI